MTRPQITQPGVTARPHIYLVPHSIQLLCCPARGPGFTLIELLTVTAIIGLLAALLLPALSRARAAAGSVACIRNLREAGLGLRLYVDEFAEYPPFFPTGLPMDVLEYWPDLLQPYCNNDWRVLVCPGSPDRLGYPIPYGYNRAGTGGTNSLGVGGILTSEPGAYMPLPESRVVCPADMVAIGDGSGFYFDMFPYESWIPGMTASHNGGANAVFCDGHVESARVSIWFKADVAHRKRWNNDNQPHSETWPQQ